MRQINRIIIHCSATPEGRPDTIDDIRGWHMHPNRQPFPMKDVAYHYVVHIDGSVHAGRPESVVGAHAGGHNHDSIGVCYVGGMTADMKSPKDTRTPAQKNALKALVRDLLDRYPGATVHGHREFAPKACPSFDVQAETWDEGEGNRMDGTLPDPRAAALTRIMAATEVIRQAVGEL